MILTNTWSLNSSIRESSFIVCDERGRVKTSMRRNFALLSISSTVMKGKEDEEEEGEMRER